MRKEIKGRKKARLNRISSICADIAQVAMASIVIPFLIDKFDPVMLLLGLITAFIFWVFSLLAVR